MLSFDSEEKKYDFSTLLGISLALALVAIAILLGGGTFKSYIDYASILIVFGGTLFVTSACFSFEEMFQVFGVIKELIFHEIHAPVDVALQSMQTSKLARDKGLLQLQNAVNAKKNLTKLYTQGVSFLVDNLKHEEISMLIEAELMANFQRSMRVSQIIKKAAEVSPAMGLIGTLIGLLQMLSNLSDISRIGPAMAVALITTFYGAVLSYMVFIPLSSKIDRNAEQEYLNSQIYKEAFVSIAKKENPRQLETKLNSLLSSYTKLNYFEN